MVPWLDIIVSFLGSKVICSLVCVQYEEAFSRSAILSQQKDLYLADTHPRPPLEYWGYIKFPYFLMKELWNLDTDGQDINFKPLAPSPYLSHTLTHSGRGETIGHTSLHVSLCCD